MTAVLVLLATLALTACGGDGLFIKGPPVPSNTSEKTPGANSPTAAVPPQ